MGPLSISPHRRAAGTLVDQSLLDVPIDYGSSARGISIGAGGFLVCDQTVAPVSLLRELLHFFAVEIMWKVHPLPGWHLAPAKSSITCWPGMAARVMWLNSGRFLITCCWPPFVDWANPYRSR